MRERKYNNAHPAAWGGNIPDSWEGVQVGLLALILDELRSLNATMRCKRTQAIPLYLERIAKNTEKRKRKNVEA